MTEKQKPLQPVRPPRTQAERDAWGRMKPQVYGDSAGKRFGNWLTNLFTGWMR